MLKHRTTDPALRACHIADRLEREHEAELINQGQFAYKDWPSFWLQTREGVLKEMYEGLRNPQEEQARSEALFAREQQELFDQTALERFTEADQRPNPGTYGTDYGDLEDG